MSANTTNTAVAAFSTTPKSRLKRGLAPLFCRRRLLAILRKGDLATLSYTQLAITAGVRSPAAIERLCKRLKRESDGLLRKGAIDSQRKSAIAAFLNRLDPLTVSEALSPYSALLSEREFYRTSDAETRRRLRRSIEGFARHHRLSPESAALLWKGETAVPSRIPAILLLLPLPLAVAVIVGIGKLLPFVDIPILLILLPTVWYAFHLGTAALLRKILPTAPLPLLQSGKGHPVLTVGVGQIDRAETALSGMARIIGAGVGDGDYLLILTRSDHVVCEAAGEDVQAAKLQAQVDALAKRLEVSITLQIAPRTYDARKKRWRGRPDWSALTALVREQMGEDNAPREAVCILPADAAILPGSGERMAAALFHPLCNADGLVFLSPADSPLPGARLATLRQCLLQKFDAPADHSCWGIYRIEAMERWEEATVGDADQHRPRKGVRAIVVSWLTRRSAPQAEGRISLRLSAQPLFAKDGGMQTAHAAPLRQTPSLLPLFRWLVPILRPLLLFGMIAAKLPAVYLLLLWGAASADLILSALLSLRWGARFYLYTVPAWRRLGVAFLRRALLPMEEIWTEIDRANSAIRQEKASKRSSAGLCLLALPFGGAVIATGAPLAFSGLIWCIAPLLVGDVSIAHAPTAKDKASYYALAERLYPSLQAGMDGLPPAYLTESGERAPYTTPITLGTRLMAELSACDLGIIDPHTLERRVDPLLAQMEKLPTRCGLPYARYDSDTGDYYKDSRIDSTSCGLYALCLAAAEAGIRSYATRQPGLAPIAERLNRLSMQMDFTLLFREDHTLCRTLSPTGEQEGALTYLFGDGIALFAALSSDSTAGMGGDELRAAWQALQSPAVIRGGRCNIASERGELIDYLLPSLFLPSPRGSLLSYGTRQAVQTVLREAGRAHRPFFKDISQQSKVIAALGKRIRLGALAKSPAVSDSTHPHSWSERLSMRRKPLPVKGGSAHLCQGGAYQAQDITAPVLCLLLPHAPRPALALLTNLTKDTPHGGFADPARPDRIPQAGLALAVTALAAAVTGQNPAKRLMALPRCGALYPFLCRRPDAAEARSAPTTSDLQSNAVPSPPSVCLLGSGAHGLLVARGRGISLWEGGVPLTAPTPANQLFGSGRMSGLLLFRDGALCPSFEEIGRREAGRLTLCGRDGTLQIARTPMGWSLCYEQAQTEAVEVRFLFCPSCDSPVRLSEERVTTESGELFCLCVEYSPTLAAVIALDGVADPFTHADPSPFPRGNGQIASILRISPKPAVGMMTAPACIIGGRLLGRHCTLRLAVAATKTAALEGLCTADFAPADLAPATDLPLPAPEGGLAARVLEWQLSALFEGSPTPSGVATGGVGSDALHLNRCISGGRELLTAKGFPASDLAPTVLSVSRREGAEALIARLLSAKSMEGETPLLPAESKIRYPDGDLSILRGRDLPAIARRYGSGIGVLIADPEDLRLRLTPSGEEFPICMFLHQEERTLLLPAAAAEVRYLPGEAIFSGDGFTLRLALLPRLPLLAIRLTADGQGELNFPALPSPDKVEAGDSIWYMAKQQALFCRRLESMGEQIWLIGSFPRAHDRLYYWVRERITPQTLPGIVEGWEQRQRQMASLLRIEGEEAPPIPALAATVMQSDFPAKALLSPILAPDEATADLIRLAMSAPTLLLPIALLIRVRVDDDFAIAHLRIPTEGGRASLYFLAARSLEKAMEEDGQSPLLPAVVEAFARLAEEIGDHTGLAHYTDFAPLPSAVGSWNSLPQVSRRTATLLSALLRGEAEAIPDLWEAIRGNGAVQNPFDCALLWCSVLWGVLGFIPHREGFTLAPMAVDKAMQFHLSYKGEWQIRLSPDEPPLCVRGNQSAPSSPQTEEKIVGNPIISPKTVAIPKEMV
jgi:hypothetical protein